MQFHFLFIFTGGVSFFWGVCGGVNTHVYGVSGSGSTGNCRTLFIQSPVSIQRVPMQTSADYPAKNVSHVLEEQPSWAGRVLRASSVWNWTMERAQALNHAVSNTAAYNMLFYQSFLIFCLIFFYHSRSLPSLAKLIDYVLYQHPPLILTSSGKRHPSHLPSRWGLFMHPRSLQLQHLSPNWEGSFSSSGSPA